MANRRLNPQIVSDAGIVPNYTNDLLVADTHLVNIGGKVILHFKKSGVGICNVTIITPATLGGKAVEDPVVAIPASGGDKFIGPFDRNLYSDSAGDLKFTVSEVTGLSVAVIEVP